VESFSATLLVGGGGNQLIYGSFSHLLKTSMRRRKEVHTRALARLAGQGGAKGAGARHLREWSVEIRLLALRERGLLLQFQFLDSWFAES
jgi:hypothetical protein